MNGYCTEKQFGTLTYSHTSKYMYLQQCLHILVNNTHCKYSIYNEYIIHAWMARKYHLSLEPTVAELPVLASELRTCEHEYIQVNEGIKHTNY